MNDKLNNKVNPTGLKIYKPTYFEGRQLLYLRQMMQRQISPNKQELLELVNLLLDKLRSGSKKDVSELMNHKNDFKKLFSELKAKECINNFVIY